MSCWVDDNKYEIFEVPSRDNRYPGYGDFIFLAHNTSFNYWVFGEMSFTLNYSKTQGTTSTYERALYKPYGIYTTGNEDSPSTIKKTVLGKNVTYGGKNPKNILFDSCGCRKKSHSAMEGRTIDQVNKTRNQYKKSVNEKSNIKIYKIKHK